MRILLIAGGWSNEREIALLGAEQIKTALYALGHEVILLDPQTRLQELIPEAEKCDFAFINLHGSPGEDGLIQAILDRLNVPYQGANPAASQLCLNKTVTKMFFARHDLPTAPWAFLPRSNRAGSTAISFGYPRVIKPNNGGSSVGIMFAETEKAFKDVLACNELECEDLIVETRIKGREITCAVLDTTPLPPVLITPRKGTFFDYASKYDDLGADEICPAPISPELTLKIQDLALAAHQALGIDDYSRTDFLVDDHDNPFLLEINTLPGMTRASLLPKEAIAAGMCFEDLITKLIELGMRKKKMK
ncbi:MAG: D-alanine--D-alanine ligase [Desulfoplanes sp.]|nr:D-alanine--D-alanine ligase [Desulfoplanes sp.]